MPLVHRGNLPKQMEEDRWNCLAQVCREIVFETEKGLLLSIWNVEYIAVYLNAVHKYTVSQKKTRH